MSNNIEYLSIFRFLNIKPIAICDSSLEKIGTYIDNFRITSIEECISKHLNFNILIASIPHYDDIGSIIFGVGDPYTFFNAKKETNENHSITMQMLSKHEIQ